MCFSATASFTASAVLIPLGAYTLTRAYRADHRWLPLAALPLVFGLQQLIEGVLWLLLDDPGSGCVKPTALGFTFFAYWFWPMWVPFAAWWLETDAIKRRLFLVCCVLGTVGGAYLYLPLLFQPEWLQVGVVRGSIQYQPRLYFEALLNNDLLRLGYGLMILLPLLVHSRGSVRQFGVLVTGSVVISAVFYAWAFASVWCFFAAIISSFVAWMIHRERRQQLPPEQIPPQY